MRSTLLPGLMVLALACIAPACKKGKASIATGTPVPTYDTYSQLKVGNYWVYRRYDVYYNGTVTPKNETDSCYIEKDTVIRGKTYFKYRKFDFIFHRPEVAFLRDSLHCIINSGGHVLFSYEDFTTVFHTSSFTSSLNGTDVDTLYKITGKMTDKDLDVTVPAGKFVTSNMQMAYTAYPVMHTQGIPDTRNINVRYAKNVGLIVETEPFYASAPWMTERRLLRYHLN